MRVIGGEFRSRRLKTLPGRALRPTPDRLRETLFDVLAPRIAGTVFLDAYAGSGAVGIEALSRGAARAIFVENHRGGVEVIHQNLKSLGLEGRAEVVCGTTLAALARRRADIVFLDPPYDLTAEYDAVLRALGESPPALAIAQHPARLALKEGYGQLRRVRLLKQGDNALSFYEPAGAGSGGLTTTR
jgi:16S rRNA (guanine966-N2)-methyltransferase